MKEKDTNKSPPSEATSKLKACKIFVIADTLVLALITVFPQICLWLPNTMG
jgi:TRAP-type C4-dicarboxylate transport system permease large subunit